MLQIVQHLAGGELRAIDVGGRQQHRELVAAQTRDGVRRAQGVAQPRRHFLQHQIAGVMPEGVVDLLEAVEIDQQHRQALVIAMRAQDRLLQSIEEQRAVGKIGQRVVIGEIGDALVGQVTLAPHRGFAQFPLDGRRQPLEVVLHDVVVRAGSHRGHGGVFADRAGDKNERQIRMLFANDRQRLGAAEARHRVVGDHQVPLGLVRARGAAPPRCRPGARTRRSRRGSARARSGPHHPACPRPARGVRASFSTLHGICGGQTASNFVRTGQEMYPGCRRS